MHIIIFIIFLAIPFHCLTSASERSTDAEIYEEFGSDVEIIRPEKEYDVPQKTPAQKVINAKYLSELKLELKQNDLKIESIEGEIESIKNVIPSSSIYALDKLAHNQFDHDLCLQILRDETYLTNYQFYQNYWGISGHSITYPAVDSGTKVYCEQYIRDRQNRERLFIEGNARIRQLEFEKDRLTNFRDSLIEQMSEFE